MAADFSSLVATGVSSGGLTWFAIFVRDYLAKRSDRSAIAQDRDVKIEAHRDQLMLDLLAAARTEVAQVNIALTVARSENDVLRLAQNRSAHFDQCLELLENLLKARQSGNTEEIKANERMAQAFVTRMKRLANANGTLANEAQVAASTENLGDLAKDILPPAKPAAY